MQRKPSQTSVGNARRRGRPERKKPAQGGLNYQSAYAAAKLERRVFQRDCAAVEIIGHVRNDTGDAGGLAHRQRGNAGFVLGAGMNRHLASFQEHPVVGLEPFVDRTHLASRGQTLADINAIGLYLVLLRGLADLWQRFRDHNRGRGLLDVRGDLIQSGAAGKSQYRQGKGKTVFQGATP